LESEEGKTKYLNLELENEALKDQLQTFQASQLDTEEIENLKLERDEAIRNKNELEQEVLALNNLVKNKNQELNNKEKTLAQTKKEAQEKELNWQTKIKELKELKELQTRESPSQEEEISPQEQKPILGRYRKKK